MRFEVSLTALRQIAAAAGLVFPFPPATERPDDGSVVDKSLLTLRDRISNMVSLGSSFRRLKRSVVPMGCVALSLAACADGSGLRPVPPYDPGQYKLGIDDQIRVMTYGQDQLTSDFRVDSNGKVAFPLTDGLQAAGLTTGQFADEVRDALEKSRMLRDPKVSVEVTAYRMISVLGEVARPGQYPYQPGMTMLTAIAAAGGFTYRSLESRTYVVRQEDDHTVVGKLRPQDYVKPGDVLKVYERHF